MNENDLTVEFTDPCNFVSADLDVAEEIIDIDELSDDQDLLANEMESWVQSSISEYGSFSLADV